MAFKNKIYKKRILFFSILLSIGFSAQAQTLEKNIKKEKSDFWKKVRYGGGLGLDVTNGFLGVTVAPSAIYQFNNKFAFGAGLNATYNSSRNNFKSTILGGNLISLYNVFNGFQLSGELEQLNVNRTFESGAGDIKDNFWTTGLLAGAGYRQGNATFGVRYNFLHNGNSVYATPWIPFVRFYF